MRFKKKPRLCGGCSTAQSATWHRQRGNNKYFCDDCQQKKLCAKKTEKEAPYSEASCSTTTNAIEQNQEQLQQQQQQECHGENETRQAEKTEILLETGPENEDPSTTITTTAANTTNNDPPTITTEKAESIITMEEESKKSPRHSDEPEKKESSTPPPGDESKKPEEEKMQLEAEAEEDASKNEEEKQQSGKKSSVVIQPRFTRLRSSNRPIRAATLTSFNKRNAAAAAGDKGEKSHQKSSQSCRSGGGTTSNSSKSHSSNISSSYVGAATGGSAVVVPRNKGRRHVFKLAKPEKARSKRASVSTFSTLWHKGQQYRQNDVVSVVDEQDGNIYYALIRGLLRDEYCRQSACLTWLVPTTAAPADRSFDALTYVIGPEDETFYSLDSVHFVCHIDREYFHCRGATLSSFAAVQARAATNTCNSLNPRQQFVGLL